MPSKAAKAKALLTAAPQMPVMLHGKRYLAATVPMPNDPTAHTAMARSKAMPHLTVDSESLKKWNDDVSRLYLAIGHALHIAYENLIPFARYAIEAERGSPIGRKRRARRARGRRRYAG
jgi:hypothetical protein